MILGPQTGRSPTCPQNTSPVLNPLDISDADIIIQSCDLVYFRVNKSTLSMSSPFFHDMFSLPQPTGDEIVGGLAVVRLSEDAEVLNSLLTMLYPIPSVIPVSYDRALMLLATSQKYDMVGLQSRIRADIQYRKFPTHLAAEAFRAYAIASREGLTSERESSAHLTLDFPMTFENLCDELQSFDGWSLRDLIGYRKRCRDNLILCFKSFLILSRPQFNIWMYCKDLVPHTAYSPSWLNDLFKKRISDLENAFTNPLRNPSDIREDYLSALQAHLISQSCASCMRAHSLKGEGFCKVLEDRLALAIRKVGLRSFRRNSEHRNIHTSSRYAWVQAQLSRDGKCNCNVPFRS